MPPPEIRLVRSNISLYLSLIIRLAVSVGFAIIVARKLDVNEFATIGLIMAFYTITQQLTTIWTFWAQRWTSRGEYKAVSTGLVLSIFFAFLILPVYIAFSKLESWVLGINERLLYTGWAFVWVSPILYYLTSIALVTTPSKVGILKGVYETSRFIIAYLLVVTLRQGYSGAVLALTIAAALTTICYFAILARSGIRAKGVDFKLARYWLGNWKIPLLYMITRIMRLFNRPYISWVTGSSTAVAYLNVAVASETPLIMASNLTAMPMYSRILRKPRTEDVEVSISLFLLFTGLLATIFIGAAKPIANLYNPDYLRASTALQLVAIFAIVSGIANIIRQALLALEQPEVNMEKIEGGNLLYRTLKYATILIIVPYLVAAPIVYITREDPASAVETFLSILILFSLVQLALFGRWLTRMLEFKPPVRDISAVVAGLTLSILYLVLSGVNSQLYARFWDQIKPLAIHSIVALAIYTIVIVALSPLARRIINRGLEEVKRW
ncbi:MAG: hypothetical protein F7B19_02360 [Desulfurococcales archaeon]|nr:hypothetical protein [Desulfurococcales archaeon]